MNSKLNLGDAKGATLSITLDDLCDKYFITKPKFMKVDEGSIE
jgi:hypothetical protein